MLDAHACMRAANRVMQGMFMLLEAKRWAQRTHPWCACVQPSRKLPP